VTRQNSRAYVSSAAHNKETVHEGMIAIMLFKLGTLLCSRAPTFLKASEKQSSEYFLGAQALISSEVDPTL